MIDIRRTLAMLGIGAWLAMLAFPFASYALYQQSTAAAHLRNDSFSSGEMIEDGAGFVNRSIWAQPADIDLADVKCVGFDVRGENPRALPVEKPESGPSTANDERGTFVYLTTSTDDSVWSAKCTGSELETLAVSRTPSRDLYRHAAYFMLGAIPFLFVIGLAVRRSGARLNGEHVPRRTT